MNQSYASFNKNPQNPATIDQITWTIYAKN